MSLSSIGDMRQHFMNTRSNTAIKTELNTLVQELNTGEVSDLTAHLGSGQTQLASVDRQLEMLERFGRANVETGHLLTMMQSSLGRIESHRGVVSQALLTINDASSLSQVTDAGEASRIGFDATINALNARFGDRALFGGNDLDSFPLASAEDMLTELKTVSSGLTTADDVRTAVTDWFEATGGGFETLGYLGGTDGYMERTADVDQNVEISLRGDDPVLRDLMTSFALGALAGDDTMALSLNERRDLQQQLGVELIEQAVPFVGIQARIGFLEGQVEEATVRMAAQETSMGIARNSLVSADPFETASRLEQVQLQLETHYTLTARLSRLSLTEYLR